MVEVEEVRDDSVLRGYDYRHFQSLARTGEDEDGYQGEQGQLPPENPTRKEESDKRISEESESPEVSDALVETQMMLCKERFTFDYRLGYTFTVNWL